MMQKTFCNRFTPALNMFFFTLRKNLGFTAVATVLALILSPFYMMSLVENQLEYFVTERIDFVEIFFPASIILAVGATLFLIILLYINFNFLYSKSASDAFHSVPITRTKMLLARFFASFVSSVIPVIAAYIGFIAVSLNPNVEGDISTITLTGLYTVFMMLFCGAFTLLFIITAGTVFDSLVAFAVLNVGLPIIVALICGMCEDHIYGIAYVDYTYYWQFTSPYLFALLKLIMYFEGDVALFPLGRTIVIAVLTALCLTAAVLLYRRRKCESAGSAYSYKFVPFIIGTIVSVVCYFILGAIFANDRMDISFWIPGVIGAMLGAVLYNIVINRGFKNIKRAIAPVCVALVAIFSVTAGISFDVLGFEDYVPENSQIESVSVTYRGMEMEFENTELATNLHKLIVKDKPTVSDKKYTNPDGYVDTDYVYYSYTLINGTKVERRYLIPFTFATSEKAEIIRKELTRELKKQMDEYGGTEFSLDGNKAGKYYNVTLTRQEGESLVNAYIADLSAADTERLFSEKYNSFDTIHIYGSWANADTQKTDYKDAVIYSSFSFSFRSDPEYTNFQNALSDIDIDARNRAEEYEK